MGPIGHSAISAGLGAGVWAATNSLPAGLLTLASGVLIDADHLYEVYQWYFRKKQGKVYVFLHAWEYSIAGLLALPFLGFPPLLVGIVVGHLAHVITDNFVNGLSPWGYFISYRIFKRFEAAEIAPNLDVNAFPREILHLAPFSHKLEPWFERTIEPWLLKKAK